MRGSSQCTSGVAAARPSSFLRAYSPPYNAWPLVGGQAFFYTFSSHGANFTSLLNSNLYLCSTAYVTINCFALILRYIGYIVAGLLLSSFFSTVQAQPSLDEMENRFDEVIGWLNENAVYSQSGLILRTDPFHYQVTVQNGESFKGVQFDVSQDCVQVGQTNDCVRIGEQVTTDLPHWHLTDIEGDQLTLNYADARFNALISRSLLRMYEETQRTSYLHQAGEIMDALLNQVDDNSGLWLRLRKSDSEPVYIARVNSFLLLSSLRYSQAADVPYSTQLRSLAASYEFTDEGVWNHWQSAVLGLFAKSEILGTDLAIRAQLEEDLGELQSQIQRHDGKIPYVMDSGSNAYPDFRSTYQTLDARLLARLGAETNLEPNILNSDLWALVWDDAVNVNYASYWANNIATPLYVLRGSNVDHDEWMLAQSDKPIFTRAPRDIVEGIAILRAVSATLQYWSARGDRTVQLEGGREGNIFSPAQTERGSNDNPVGRLRLESAGLGAFVEGLNVSNYESFPSGLDSLSLWLSEDASFSVDEDTELSSKPYSQSVHFENVDLPVNVEGMYLFVAADLDSTASGVYEPIVQNEEDIQVSGSAITEVNGRSTSTFEQLHLSRYPIYLGTELKTFTASMIEDDAVMLRWRLPLSRTAEVFEVQRQAATSTSWETIQSVEGHNTAGTASEYQFEDTSFPFQADTLNYRLVISDGNSSETISTETSVVRNRERLSLELPYPNPTTNQITIPVVLPNSHEEGRLGIYDILGREVRRVGYLDPGRHAVTVDVGNLSSGTYFVRIETSSDLKTRKISVIR